ncbi:host-nuclease inhibitor Gam family protein [Paramagnetospirillum magneticum]|uniref:Mu-like prophage FluMu host-nuclease inhibitor protein Gam n=1 Tax=Paramagnetospirillum magneticum (strain ATCC 700264 / AMB-1) TaxID=342108 RepID=Q2WA67_PARM1|nr:host-nuclease inhibitor Gam family protein [Paramagnetospirillum magneticum]BAE49258.1 Mu-like prophage FluMu host-nuclease inhibitor protein Gam [Paramagnetospirillum magneticum AMB-1]
MAKAATRMKVAAAAFAVPQTAEEANDFVAKLGAAQRERTLIETAMNDELAAVKARHEAEAKPFKDEIEALTRGLHTYAEANRDALTRDGKVKFHRFAAGEIAWRTRPPKVTVRGIDTVVEALKRLGLTRFLRVKEEVNKEAMLAEPEVATTVAGVTIGSGGEDFIVKPFETELEEVAP